MVCSRFLYELKHSLKLISCYTSLIQYNAMLFILHTSRAELATKAKLEKVAEIKRLNAQMVAIKK